MEESVASPLASLLGDVVNQQHDLIERKSNLSQLRLRPPASLRPSGGRWSRRRPGRPARWLWLPALGAGIAAGVFWFVSPAPLTYLVEAGGFAAAERSGATADVPRTGDRVVAQDRPISLRFSDGSLVELASGSTARVVDLDARGVRMVLEEGRAEVSVKHRARTRWNLEAGPFEVHVTGTKFSLGWDRATESVAVLMREGSVEIASRHRPSLAPVRVVGGQRYSASTAEARWTIDAVDPAAPAGNAPPGPPVGPPTSRSSGPVSAATTPKAATLPAPGDRAPGLAPPTPTAAIVMPPSVGEGGPALRSGHLFTGGVRQWQVLARRGRYQEALDTAERAGGFAATCRRLGPEELVQLGDVARLAGNAARAEQAYKLARKRYPRMDRPVFGLGLVAFEQRQDYAAAGRWFEAYRNRFPTGPLQTEATGRAMESWHRAGNHERAAAAAADYLEHAPNGPYAPLARQIANP